VTVALAGAATALAAHPKRSAHFTGTTNESPVNGFPAPVTFTVSRDGKSLTGFAYSSFGCQGAGGFRPGIDYYTQPSAIIKVGTVRVSPAGRLSVSGAAWAQSGHGVTTTTTTRVSGSFLSAKSVRGTIVFSQTYTGAFKASCGPATLSFTAKTR
jgi:hypothetical protein